MLLSIRFLLQITLAFLCLSWAYAGDETVYKTTPSITLANYSASPQYNPSEDFSKEGFWNRAWVVNHRHLNDRILSKFKKPILPPAPPIPWEARHGLSASQYQEEFDHWTQQGYRLSYVSGYERVGEEKFAAIWEQTSGPERVARHGLSSEDYQREFDLQLARGFRPILLNGYSLGDSERYVAIWEQNSGVEWVARHGLSASQYQEEFDQNLVKGFRLSHVSGYSVGGVARFAGIWEKSPGPAWVARHDLTAPQYQTEFVALADAGYQLKTVSGYFVGGSERYAAIWEKGDPMMVWQAKHGLAASEFQQEFEDYRYQGYRPVVLGGYSDGLHSERYAAVWRNDAFFAHDLRQIDRIAEQALEDWQVPALSFAIAKDGKLLFAKAYGYADVEAGQPVHARSRFRIASLSKTITAAAVLKLVEEGRLNLQDKVFGATGILGARYTSSHLFGLFQAQTDHLNEITVKHLLQHTAGGWDNMVGDPMFQHKTTMNRDQLIQWTLLNRPLEHRPGHHFAYSNFGYCLLGRIVEQVTGQTYEEWVRANILIPAGAKDMEIGRNTLNARRPGEVVYYDGDDDMPYEINLARMDSPGGWIASPADLLRFAVRIDGFATKPDLFDSEDTITTMTTPWMEGEGYAMGWEVIPEGWWWHTGSLPGTSSVLVRAYNGYVLTVVTNSRENSPDLQPMIWEIIDKVIYWPEHDLF